MHLLTAGNQDTTTALWDIRRTGEPLALLPGRMGAIRSVGPRAQASRPRTAHEGL